MGTQGHRTSLENGYVNEYVYEYVLRSCKICSSQAVGARVLRVRVFPKETK